MDKMRKLRPRSQIPLVVFIGILVVSLLWLAGCGDDVLEIKSVAELKERAADLEGKKVQITGEVQFVGESNMDRFLLRDPAAEKPEDVLVRCSREDFRRIKKELSKGEKNRLAVVGTVYLAEPPQREVRLQFSHIAGGKLRWWLITAMAAVACAIAVVLALLLRSPKREPDLVYTEDSQETIRKYASLKIFEDDRLQRMWYLSYDMSILEPKITNVDIVIGTAGLLIGRDNPALGLVSQTYARRIAVLSFHTQSREFRLENVHARQSFTVSDGKGTAPGTTIGPGKSCVMQNGYRLHIDESVFVQLERKEGPIENGGTQAGSM